MRKSLGLKENSQIMLISDSESKEIKVIPLPFNEEKTFIRLKILIADQAGALGKIASAFGDLNISLLYGETIVIKKGINAEWNVLAPISDFSIEDLKKYLIENGGAKSVQVMEPRVGLNIEEIEDD